MAVEDQIKVYLDSAAAEQSERIRRSTSSRTMRSSGGGSLSDPQHDGSSGSGLASDLPDEPSKGPTTSVKIKFK